eukprot:5076299-Prymnesium_polylepis.1
MMRTLSRTRLGQDTLVRHSSRHTHVPNGRAFAPVYIACAPPSEWDGATPGPSCVRAVQSCAHVLAARAHKLYGCGITHAGAAAREEGGTPRGRMHTPPECTKAWCSERRVIQRRSAGGRRSRQARGTSPARGMPGGSL